MRQYLVMGLALAFCLFIISGELKAQTSIGYSDPDDISNLLEYRLPDWNYRIWNMGFSMNGSNYDSRQGGSARADGDFTGNLGSEYEQTWESEQRLVKIQARVDGYYSRSFTEAQSYDANQHQLVGEYYLSFDGNHYLGDSLFSLRGSGATGRRYEEFEDVYTSGNDQNEFTEYGRRSRHDLSMGVGWGRLRNVVPLLRAQRLSERLMTMGRPGLNAQQVQEIARVMATEYAYREVFDREDRYFWSEVLAPMLDPDNPLSPFEVFYLTDVLNEDLGDRAEGFEISLSGKYEEQQSDYSYYNGQTRRRSTDLAVKYFHNYSLSHQLKISAYINYYWMTYSDGEEDDGRFDLEVAHLWNLADRYSLETYFQYSGNVSIPDEYGRHNLNLGSTFRVYLEDRVSLATSINGGYYWNDYSGDENFGWALSYRLGLQYHLDRLIF